MASQTGMRWASEIVSCVVSEPSPNSVSTVCHQEEFPISTLCIETVEHQYGRARRVWVVDRGLLSEANLEAIREHQGHYLAGTPRAQRKKFEKQLLAGSWERVRDDVEVQLIASEDSAETFVLCGTPGGKKKSRPSAIVLRRGWSRRWSGSHGASLAAGGKTATRFCCGWAACRLCIRRWPTATSGSSLPPTRAASCTGGVMMRTPSGGGCAKGAYLLRTNLGNKDPAELWRTYVQLTEVEAAFRALKSELAIRPLYHQLERPVQAHILVAFLGYALWATLKQLLCRSGAELSPARALALLSSLSSGDLVLPTTAGREIRLRRVTEPTEEQNRLLTQLGLRLPRQRAHNRECSADFAVT